MTRQISDVDHLYVVPLDAMSLADAFANSDNAHGVWRLSYDAADMPLVREDDRPVLDVIEEIPGGCLVRIGALANDIAGLAAFLADRDGPATLQALEQSFHRTERFVESIGGHLACRSKGRWRPYDPVNRAAWGAHLVRWNAQQMRAKAMLDRMMKPHRAAAAALTQALKAA